MKPKHLLNLYTKQIQQPKFEEEGEGEGEEGRRKKEEGRRKKEEEGR